MVTSVLTTSYMSAVRTVVGIYRHSVGLLLPTACKHYPTCSEYCIQAFDSHGVIKGARLTVLRLLRCHPLSRGGYDPVPPARG